MNQKQIFAVCIILVISWGSISNVSPKIIPQQDSIKQIVVIFPASGGKDESIISKANEALDQLQSTFADEVNFTRIYPSTISEGTESVTSQAELGYDLMIVIIGNVPGTNAGGGDYAGTIEIAKLDNPDLKVILLGGSLSFDFTDKFGRSINYLEHEGSFLAGALAAMVSNSTTLGFIGLEDNEIIERYKFGYYQGANFIGEQIGVSYNFLATYLFERDPFFLEPVTDGYNATISQLERGANVIFGVAGVSNFDIFDAIEEYNQSVTTNPNNSNFYAIGSNDNQDAEKPGYILTSMIKITELILIEEITSFIDGEWVQGERFLGLRGGHVALTPMIHTQAEKNAREERFNDQTREDLLKFLETAIINDEIVVYDEFFRAELNITGENPFMTKSQSSPFISNEILIGSLGLSVFVMIALLVMRQRNLRIGRKSEKSKAIDYLDRAKKMAEEPDDL